MINQLLNQEVRVKIGSYTGQTGVVQKVFADGESFLVKLSNGKEVILQDVFVEEIQERSSYPKTPQSLGPVANSVAKSTL
tara:strand:+ start:842 stop:1081 length:240 start_codon:yes stop_codon:yes gene_type:complete